VQNTYLSIFQALGGLGLLLGSAGLGMVVLRGALERRAELALLGAVGFRRAAVRRLLWGEHGLLLALGLGSAVAAAAVAVLPGLGRGGLPWMPMLALVSALACSGAVWVWLAAALATRGPLLESLHEG
jgi:ABC-type antimicrobial peptide transport system permease subunit